MDLQAAGEGIYYCVPNGNTLPSLLEVYGQSLYRFLDFIYLPVQTEDLTPAQIAITHELRRIYLPKLPALEVNRRVRSVLLRLLRSLVFDSIVEIGPGYEPLYRRQPPNLAYLTADLNPAVVSALQSLRLRSCVFSASDMLPVRRSSIDIIVALFVWHFRFPAVQIRELVRVLRDDGIVVGNVYRRTPASRATLYKTFVAAGLEVSVFPDPLQSCAGNEYWCLYRQRSSRLFLPAVKFFSMLEAECLLI